MTETDFRWQIPSLDPELSDNEVHIWLATLKQPVEQIRQLAHTLCRKEMIKSQRFRVERDQHRFIVGRGVLRAILGRYLKIYPDQLRFCYEERGKPLLADNFNNRPIQFNLSHTHEIALYAFTSDREIGVDVEYVRPMQDMEQIAARFFSISESAVLLGLPEGQKLEAFFNCWTRKEAYIKALGEGLAKSLKEFEVSLTPGEPAELLKDEERPEEVGCWSIKSLRPYSGHIAAVAVKGHVQQFKYWQWHVGMKSFD